jgi:hypothetical protein
MHEAFIRVCNDDGGYGRPMIMTGSLEGGVVRLRDRGMRARGDESKGAVGSREWKVASNG